ncbi:MAG TPA: aminomethyl-transferring glycine dehydrogenase subunit GcvPA [Acholeplasmataceae bacterium]|nr:aminomethyl-transferring glycine dehydrogenase subunit GcvPA [Acholeplasmataceae bacterium]
MMHKYFPQTDSDISEMKKVIGIKDIDELFKDINPKVRINKKLNLPESMSEEELRKYLEDIGKENKQFNSFLGAGTYDTLQFSAISALTSRQEFLTSYTPYQPEIAQGTLQYIFEYQSMICELTGMDVSNASMYDGSTATAEAMFMAVSQTKRTKVLLSSTVDINTIDVIKTYAKYREIEIIIVEEKDLTFDKEKVLALLDDDTACFISQTPNYYGVLENYEDISESLHNNKSLFIINSDPSSLGLFKNQKEWGADIACGNAQTLGIPKSFGGPTVGYLASTKSLLRKMPGRICGATIDKDGKRGFVLTLQAREQHIRREKATSNICSNQSLMALYITIYLSLVGKQGMKEIAKRAYNNAHYFEEKLLQTKKFKKTNNQPFFKEFVLEYLGNIEKLNKNLLENNILNGLSIGDNKLLLCATETKTLQEIDDYIAILEVQNV